MVKTKSTMMELGSKASDFELIDTDNKYVSLSSYPNSKGYLIMFICNHCPFVLHIQKKLAELSKKFQEQDIAVLAINSNDTKAYPEDDLEQMRKVAQEMNYSFPYLLDSSQEVAKSYQAACTPDFFLFDQDKKLVYRGQMDASRPGNDLPRRRAEVPRRVPPEFVAPRPTGL